MAKNGPTREDVAQQIRLGGPLYVGLLLNDLPPVDRDKILDDLDSYREWQSFSPRLAKQRADKAIRDARVMVSNA